MVTESFMTKKQAVPIINRMGWLILSPMIMITLSLTLAVAWHQNSGYTEQRQEYLNKEVDLITAILAKAIFDADKQTTELIGNSLFNNPDVVHLMISDQFSRIYLKTRLKPGSEAEHILDPLIISRPLSYQIPSGERILMGNITVHFALSPINLLLKDKNIWLLLSALINLAALYFILRLVIRKQVTRPLQQLTEKLRASAEQKSPPARPDSSLASELQRLYSVSLETKQNCQIHQLRQKEIHNKLVERTHEVAEGKESSRLLTNMLQSSQKRYRALFHRNVDPVLIVEPYRVGSVDINRIIDANQAALTLLQLPQESLTHQDFEDKFGIKPLEHGSYRLPEGTLMNPYQTSPRHIELHFNMVVYENHSLYYVTLRDITDKVRAETLEKEANELMSFRQNQMAISEMATTIAHELNQPLAAIRNYSQSVINFSMKDNSIKDEKITESLIQLKQQADIASDIVKQARGKSGRNDYPQEALEFIRLIQSTIDLCQLRADKENISLLFETEQNNAWIFGNDVQLKQLIINLISNAIEVINEGNTDERRVTLCLNRKKEHFILVVEDTGPGIEDTSRVFNTHYTTKKNGLGMGLSICRSIAEMHHSSIQAESSQSGGARFILNIPAYKSDNAGTSPAVD